MNLPRPSSQSYVESIVSRSAGALFGRSQRSTLNRIALIVLILMNFRTFEYFPGFRPAQDAWYGLSIVVFLVLYPLCKIALGWTFTRLELYLLVILPVLLILPAITAYSVFGQPLYYGIFPQRSASVLLWWILMINAWRLRWFSIEDLNGALFFLIWATFIFFNLMRFLLNPGNFDQFTGFVVGYGSEAQFTLPSIFATFGAFYYVFRAIRTQRSFLYGIAAIQLLSAMGRSGRSLAAGVVLTTLVFLFSWRGLRSSLPVVAGALCGGALVLGASFIVSPQATSDRVAKFHDALLVASGASEVEDISANARIYESATAKPYVAQHPLLGVGAVSLQWEGGLVGALGTYFVPGDIGLLGVMFTYGAFGLITCAAQYLFAARAVSGGGQKTVTPFADTCRGVILFTALLSTVTGGFVFDIGLTSFFITALTFANSTWTPSGKYSDNLS